jgi:hypothetical protein
MARVKDPVVVAACERLLVYLSPEERRMYTEAVSRERHAFSEILRASSELHELYRQAQLGLGPDPVWLRRLGACEARLVRAWELRREALAEVSWLLRQAAKRRKVHPPLSLVRGARSV